MRASRGLRAAVLLILALALPSTMAQTTRKPPPPPGGTAGPAPTPIPTPTPTAKPPPPASIINNGGSRRPPPPGAGPAAPTPGQVPNPTPGTGSFPGKTSFPTSPYAPLNNPALICVAQDLVHPVSGLPLGIVLDAAGQPTWNAVGGAVDERKLLVVDMPATPFVIVPFQDKWQPMAIKQPTGNEICRADGSGHCSRAYEITISDEKLRPFDRVVPRCPLGNFIGARCVPAPVTTPPPLIPPNPVCTRVDIPTYTGTWFLTYDGMTPGPMMRVAVGHEVMLRFNNRICTNELAGIVDPFAPPPAGGIPPTPDPICVAQAAGPKGVFFGNGPPLPPDALVAGAIVPPPLCETRLNPFGVANPGRGRGIVVHHHGSASVSPFDGWAEDMTCWGETKDYMYPVNRPTTAWYHDHALHTTHWNALYGLQGMFVHSAKQADGGCGEPWNLDNIPDMPMILGDQLLDQQCQKYKPLEAEYMFFGDINTVNGVPFPVMDLEPKTYRFRFLDASVSRPWVIKLKSGGIGYPDRGATMCYVIAGDGGFRQTPVRFPVEGLLMGVAERYEVVCDFSGVPGQTFYWWNDRDLITFDGGGLLHNQVPYFCWSHLIAQIRVGARTSATVAAPKLNLALGPAQSLIPIKDVISQADYDAAMAMANAGQFHRSFEFSKVVDFWTINGRTWDTARVAASDVGQNTWEVWKLLSGGTWFHPVHIHLIDAYILKRFTFRGATLRTFEQLTPKDMVFLGPTNQVYVLIRFGAHKGEYMFHCHNMVHEDADMMRSFQVRDPAVSLTASAKASQEPTAANFVVNPIQNVVYGQWQWFDPVDGLSCYDTQSTTHPLCDAQAQARQTTNLLDATLTPPALATAHQTHFDRNYYRIFYPTLADIASYGGTTGVTNPWQATVCALKPPVPSPPCNHANPC